MTYRVEELAASGGVSVDTIRYYQGLGLLDPPRKDGRVAMYSDGHLARLGRIRELAESGFTLRQISDLVDDGNGGGDPLLAALAEQAPSGASMTIVELAERTGVAEPMLRLGVDSGLLEPRVIDGEERFDEVQAGMVATVGALLESGVDVQRLVSLAASHAANIDNLVEEAVALYREAVDSQPDRDRSRIASDIQALVPAVTRLVADHFSRTLVARAAELVDDLEDGTAPA
jgi:DNA-binding transcriptional MerR regulator